MKEWKGKTKNRNDSIFFLGHHLAINSTYTDDVSVFFFSVSILFFFLSFFCLNLYICLVDEAHPATRQVPAIQQFL